MRKTSKKILLLCFILICFAVLVAGVLVWQRLLYRTIPLRISEETTFLTEPLKTGTQEPRIDYLRYFQQRHHAAEIATDENGWRFLLRHVQWPDLTESEFSEYYLRYCETLGLDPNTDPELKAVPPYDMLKNHSETNPEQFKAMKEVCFKAVRQRISRFKRLENKLERDIEAGTENSFTQLHFTRVQDAIDSMLWIDWEDEDYIQFAWYMFSLPWTTEDYPALSPLMDSTSDRIVEIVREAVNKPFFIMPYLGDGKGNLMYPAGDTEFRYVNNFCYFFGARINHHLGTGDFDRAIDEFFLMTRLQRLAGNQGTVDSYGLGQIETSYMLLHEELFILKCRFSVEQLERILSGIEQLPPFVPYEEIARNHYLETLNRIQARIDEQIAEDESYRYGKDWNVIFNEFHRAYLESLDIDPGPSRKIAFADFTSARSKGIAAALWNIYWYNPKYIREGIADEKNVEEFYRERIEELIRRKKLETNSDDRATKQKKHEGTPLWSNSSLRTTSKTALTPFTLSCLSRP